MKSLPSARVIDGFVASIVLMTPVSVAAKASVEAETNAIFPSCADYPLRYRPTVVRRHASVRTSGF
jgi:hypothetical protein